MDFNLIESLNNEDIIDLYDDNVKLGGCCCWRISIPEAPFYQYWSCIGLKMANDSSSHNLFHSFLGCDAQLDTLEKCMDKCHSLGGVYFYGTHGPNCFCHSTNSESSWHECR